MAAPSVSALPDVRLLKFVRYFQFTANHNRTLLLVQLTLECVESVEIN